MENLERQVDNILENRGDIISLRGKLNAIVNARANNNLGKNTQDIERYKTIVDYFLEKDEEGNYINKDRVSQNRTYLVDAMYNLTKYISNPNAKNLCKKIKNILDENKDDTLKQAFLNRDWEDGIY